MQATGRNLSQCPICNKFIENRKFDEHVRHCRAEAGLVEEAPSEGKSKTQQIKDLVLKHYGKHIEIDYSMGEMTCKRNLKKIDLKLWVDSRKYAENLNVELQDALLKVLQEK